jgi:hypothetical protein
MLAIALADLAIQMDRDHLHQGLAVSGNGQ